MIDLYDKCSGELGREESYSACGRNKEQKHAIASLLDRIHIESDVCQNTVRALRLTNDCKLWRLLPYWR